MFIKLGDLMFFCQQNIRKTFIVAQQHIIARLHLLNQIGFQQQRIGLGFGADKFHIAGRVNHARDAIIMPGRAGIGPHTHFQIFRLADI